MVIMVILDHVIVYSHTIGHPDPEELFIINASLSEVAKYTEAR